MKITKVRAILTAPDNIALIVVKVETDQPGLYGLGCATYTQRPTLVAQAVDEYLDPLLQGTQPGQHRRHLAPDVCQSVLAQWARAEQRHQRGRYGPVGPERQSRGHAGL